VSLDRSSAERVFRENERYLFALAYRLTGTAADADDVVQETFARLLAHPPARTDEPLRPWLTRVAVNCGRDVLRRRRRQAYVGPWLPSPLETGDLADDREGPEARYGRLESAGIAFLRALEALTPKARAVLVLRDAVGYSVQETADALEISAVDVKTTLHRARRALAEHDAARRPMAETRERTRVAVERFLAALALEDASAIEACLAASVRAASDAGGESHAALNVVSSRARVIRFLRGLVRKNGPPSRFDLRVLNGLPALVAEHDAARAGFARRYVLRFEVDGDGLIDRIEIVIAARKLHRVGFPEA
jgi:RNA polymerase sigma-70 factor (ECF subfamily)